VLSRLARWWLARAERGRKPDPYVPSGECCAPGCGVEVRGDALHAVVELSTDDDALGIDGQTGMAADYCGEHCPGGCRHGCVASAA
jgi:hypothetical protein